jgi:hypothetical protein
MAASHNFTGLMVTRLLLGTFEASVGMFLSCRAAVVVEANIKLTTPSTHLRRRCSNVVSTTRTNDKKRRVVFYARVCRKF